MRHCRHGGVQTECCFLATQALSDLRQTQVVVRRLRGMGWRTGSAVAPASSMKKTKKRLTLSSETLRLLEPNDLHHIIGAGRNSIDTECNICHSRTDTACTQPDTWGPCISALCLPF